MLSTLASMSLWILWGPSSLVFMLFMLKSMPTNKLIFYGGVGEATGPNTMLEFAGKKIIVDCGLLQGLREKEDTNKLEFKYNPIEVDFLFVTHAHMDHIGKIPKLVRD